MLCGVRAIVRNVLQVVHVVREDVREYEVQDTLPLHPPSVTVDCRQL